MYLSNIHRLGAMIAVTFWSVWGLALVADAQDRDKVFPTKGGAVAQGKITERTRDRVVIQSSRGGPLNFATNEVERIVFDKEPIPLSRSKDSASQQQWDQAKKEIDEVTESSLTTDGMREEYYFYKAYIAGNQALRGKGDLAGSDKLLLDWVKQYSNSHNFYRACETLGNLAMARSELIDAIRYYGAMAGAPFADIKLKGNFLLGKAYLAQGNAAEAKKRLTAVIQASVADAPSLKMQKLAGVSMIMADAATGDTAAAIQSLEKMVDEGDSSDAELFAELYNSLGSLFAKQGNHYEALLSYLKTDKLYSTQPDAHAEALYHLSQLWPKAGEPLRATQARAELEKLYPTSPWAKK